MNHILFDYDIFLLQHLQQHGRGHGRTRKKVKHSPREQSGPNGRQLENPEVRSRKATESGQGTEGP